MIFQMRITPWYFVQAIPEIQSDHSHRTHLLDVAAPRGAALAAYIGPSTKLFPPAHSDAALQDAALPWANPEAAASSVLPLNLRSFVERRTVSAPDSIHSAGNEPDIVDQSSFYSRTGVPLVSPTTMEAALSPMAVANAEAEDESNRRAAAVMAQIETDRVPCPRLCGAVFSSGVGGIAGM